VEGAGAGDVQGHDGAGQGEGEVKGCPRVGPGVPWGRGVVPHGLETGRWGCWVCESKRGHGVGGGCG
jgi:hypothetical protein